MPEAIRQQRISPIEKIGYGLGDTASNLVFQTLLLLLAYFYTDIFGISASAVGTLFLVVRIVDAITDPIMGIICDRTHTRWGKFRPYLLWMCLPYAIVSVITFITPEWAAGGKLIYAYITYTLLMLIYTAINIPYCALGGVITADTRQRLSLNSYRFIFATAGGVLVACATFPLVGLLGGGNDRKGYPLAMAVFAGLAVLMFLCCFALTRERVVQARTQASSFRDDIKYLLKNAPWRIVSGISFLVLIPIVIRSGTAAYYIKWYAGRPDLITPFLTAGMLSAMAGAALTGQLTRYLSKSSSYIFIQLMIVIFSLCLFFIPPARLVSIFALYAVIQFFVQMASPILWTMIADTVDYGEYTTGRRITGLGFSGVLFFIKLGIAVGGALLGWLLACFGYQQAAETQMAQTPSAIRGIVLLFTLIPAGWHVLVMGFVWRYKLDDMTCDRMWENLDMRKLKNQ